MRVKDLVLAGDIGGTNARLRLYDLSGEKQVHEANLPSGSSPSLEALIAPYLHKFLAKHRAKIRAAAFGIAGPVVGGVSRTTNLPWVVDEKQLSRELDIPVVRLINDLTAIALGGNRLPASSYEVVAPGRPTRGGNIAVIAAGTGLGEALLVWDGARYVPCASEGGHCDFAPRNELEIALLKFLAARYGREGKGNGRRGPRAAEAPQTESIHVSYERVLSGPGMGDLYDFMLAHYGLVETAAVRRRLSQGDRNARISELGLSGRSEAAARAVDVFAAVYGAEAGNLALKGFTAGGVYVCGRIGADIIPRRREIFLDAMRDKGRLGRLLAKVPVSIVLDDKVGLVGAGHLAARLAAAG